MGRPFDIAEKQSFSGSMCSDFAEHGRPKVPMRKLSPSQCKKTEVHAPGFFGFASQSLFYARCRASDVFAAAALLANYIIIQMKRAQTFVRALWLFS